MSTRVVVGSHGVKLRVFGLVALLALCAAASAAPAEPPVVAADTAEKLAQVHASVRQEMAPGGRYEFISGENREQAEKLFGDMEALLGRSPVASMPEADRLKLFNLQERLNGILTGSDSERLVCEKTAPTGSLIAVKKCRTYGEIQRQRRESERYLDETKRAHAQLKQGG